MTLGAGTITVDVDAKKALTSLQLCVKVQGKRRALWRVRIAAAIIGVAARVLGGTVELEAEFG